MLIQTRNPSVFSYFPPSSVILSLEQEWDVLPIRVVSTSHGLYEYYSVDDRFFFVGTEGERFVQKYGFFRWYLSTRLRPSAHSLSSGFILYWSMARYNLAALPELDVFYL